jgi:putative redox protein
VVSLALEWTGGSGFRQAGHSPAIVLHSSTPGVVSPPQALAYAVMGCMAMDIVHVITRGRHRLDAFTVRFEGERAPDAPRRFVTMGIRFELTTAAPPAVVERAIRLSREKYCSVLHTLRPDIDLQTSYVLAPVERVDAEAERDA